MKPGLIAFLSGLAICSCNSMFYYPDRIEYGARPIPEHEELAIQSASGNTLHGWLFKSRAAKTRGLFIFYHGNARNITAHYKAFVWLTEYGYDYVLFDYSGYGKSGGRASSESLFRDGISVLDEVIPRFDRGPGYRIIAGGQSLGGAVLLTSAAHSKRKDRIDLVFVDCTFASYKKIAEYHAGASCLFLKPAPLLLVSDEYAPERFLDRLRNVPLLISHCHEDETVPYSFGEDLYMRIPHNAKFMELHCGHTAGYWKAENRERLLRIFDGL